VVKLQIGQKALVTFDALTPNDVYEAQIVKIDPASTVIQDVVYYAIKLSLTNVDQRLKPGMSANVDIHTAEKDAVLMIPLRAVETRGMFKFVTVLDPDGITTSQAKIETGLEGDEGMVEVTKGLKEGQKVVTFTKTQ
jgi:multidrug efflux pump subunit AcrA (membrane-fusion protein)